MISMTIADRRTNMHIDFFCSCVDTNIIVPTHFFQRNILRFAPYDSKSVLSWELSKWYGSKISKGAPNALDSGVHFFFASLC